MTPRPRITLKRIPYEEPYHVCLQFEATNGMFSGFLEYYCNAEDLNKIGSALSSFPKRIGDKFLYEIGSPKPEVRFAYHFVLKAFTTDSSGHCAIEIIINNNRQPPHACTCSFSILAEPAAINRLGQLFTRFADLKHHEFTWTETDESLN